MTGPEHYREAELLTEAGCDYGCPHVGCQHHMARLAEAQVHATLALAAATALASSSLPSDWPDCASDVIAWREAAGAKQ